MSVKTLFTVYHSNQVDVLKSLLVELIRLDPLDSPFDKEQILVQSPGMSQWLKMALAKEFGFRIFKSILSFKAKVCPLLPPKRLNLMS